MIRHCEGKDETLSKRVEEDGKVKYVPCDCKATFDDTYHSVIYPHKEF